MLSRGLGFLVRGCHAAVLFSAFALALTAGAASIRPGQVVCRDEVLKVGYDQNVAPIQLAALVALIQVSSDQPFVRTRDFMELVDSLARMPRVSTEPTTRFFTTVAYPLERKGMIEGQVFAGGLEFELQYSGRQAALNNLKSYWELLRRRSQLEGARLPTLPALEMLAQRPSPVSAAPITLAQYLLLMPFVDGSSMTSSEVYEFVRPQLTYYFSWKPTTPAAVRLRLNTLARNDYLRTVAKGSMGGNPYVFAITSAGRAALRSADTFYQRLLGEWLTYENDSLSMQRRALRTYLKQSN